MAAKQKPDGVDDRNDRVATAFIYSADAPHSTDANARGDSLSPERALKSLLMHLPKPAMTSTEVFESDKKEQVKIVFDAVKDTFMKGPAAGATKLGAGELKFIAKHAVGSLHDQEVAKPLGLNTIPEFIGRTAELAGVDRQMWQKSLYPDSQWTQLGRDLANQNWGQLSEKEKANISGVMQSSDRRKLEATLDYEVRTKYLGSNVALWPRPSN